MNSSTIRNSPSLGAPAEVSKTKLLLQDGSRLTGEHFGARRSMAGEVVFNTGMVGYPEAMTDPSYRGQVLVLTYPLIGNYGVPANRETKLSENELEIPEFFESNRIQISGLIIATLSKHYSHWSARDSLDSWMQRQNVNLSPNAGELIEQRKIDLVINIPKNYQETELTNDYYIRRKAVDFAIPLLTNIQLANRLAESLSRKQVVNLGIKELQAY